MPIEEFAKGLGELILRLRTLVCRKNGKHPIRPDETLDNGVAEADFKVYLVAHSMGGLVCRAFLQNPKLGDAAGPRRGRQALHLRHAAQRHRPARGAQRPGLERARRGHQLQPRADGRLPRPAEEDRGRVRDRRLSAGADVQPGRHQPGRLPGRQGAVVVGGGRVQRRPGAHGQRHHLRQGRRASASSRRAPTRTAATRGSTASSTRKRASRT